MHSVNGALHRLFFYSAVTLSVIGATACGKETTTASSDDLPTVSEVAPDDSTGAKSTVSLQFGSVSSSTTLQLESDNATSSIEVGNGITISDARVSIAAIKLKASKNVRDDEKALDEALKKREKSRVETEEAEEISDDSTAGTSLALRSSKDKGSDSRLEKRQQLKDQRKTSRKSTDEKRLENENNADGALKIRGPFVYDLVNKTVTPTLPSIEALDGTYKRIEFKLFQNRNVDASDPLLDNVFFVKGTVRVGESDVPFMVSYHVTEHIRMSGDIGEKVQAGIENKIIVGFDIKAWFSGLDFSKAKSDESGTIVVDKSHNQEILHAIKKNIKASTRFGKDTRGDGVLDSAGASGEGTSHAEDSLGD